MSAHPRMWKISPGRNAVYWQDFKEKKIIAIGWLETVGDLSKIDDYDKIKKIAESKRYSQSAITQTWNLYKNVEVDHLAVAFGRGSILDIGRVIGKYFFDDSKNASFHNGESYFHRKEVEWLELFDRPLKVADKPNHEQLYRALRWPEDSLHEIMDTKAQKMIIDYVSNATSWPSSDQILGAISKLIDEGKIVIKKEELFEELTHITKSETVSKAKPNWKELTWERTKKLAQNLIG